MSMSYCWEFEISPVREDEREVVMQRIPYDIQDHMALGPDGTLLTCWGEGTLGGGTETSERHAELRKLFPSRRVTSHWRCTEFDEWDNTYHGDEEADDS